MRRCTRLLYLLTIALLIPFCASADFKKTKIAVLDFQLQGEEFANKDMGTIVAEWFITAMVREGRFDVVERRMLEKVLGEQQLAMTGVVDASSATQIGKLLGVKVIITGSVMKLRDITEINARIIDVESASIIAAESIKSAATSGLQEMVVEMSQKIMKNFPLEGYVVNRGGDSVTLDLGFRTGVKKGMRFIVFKEGQVIKHPKTGEVLDVERIQTGTVTIDNVMQKISTARIDEEDSAGSINYGQLVKSMIDTRPKEGRLYVDVTPAGAKIRILNITPAYTRGMVLDPGPYNIEVSAPGYITDREWVTLGLNEEKTVSFALVASTAAQERVRPSPPVSQEYVAPVRQDFSPPPPPRQEQRPAVGTQQAKYLKLLESNNVKDQRDAARLITRTRIKDPVVFDAVERALLRGYKMESTDRDHIDAMSWLCKALGSSGMGKYRSTLNTVANNAPHRKLKGYAEKSMNEL
jgi:TolB-like protein